MRSTLLGLLGIVLVGLSASAALAKVELGKPAPEFRSKQYLNSKKFTLKSLNGKVVVLALLHTQVDGCKPYMADLVKLMKEREAKGLTVVLLFEEKKAAVKKWLEETKTTYAAVAECDLRNRYGLPKVPTSFVLDVDGVVQWTGSFADRADIKIDDLLSKASKTPYVPVRFKELRAKLGEKKFAEAHAELGKALVLEDLTDEDKTRLGALKKWFGDIGKDAIEAAKKLYVEGDIWEAHQAYLKAAEQYAGLPIGETAKNSAEALLADKKTKREIDAMDYLRELFPEAQKLEAAGESKKAARLLKKVMKKFKGTRAADEAERMVDRLDP